MVCPCKERRAGVLPTRRGWYIRTQAGIEVGLLETACLWIGPDEVDTRSVADCFSSARWLAGIVGETDSFPQPTMGKFPRSRFDIRGCHP
jgi:hypothetical protein